MLAQTTWEESDITYSLKGDINLPAQITWEESDITYSLKDDINLSAQITWKESDITYKLEGEEERPICQPRLHGKNSM